MASQFPDENLPPPPPPPPPAAPIRSANGLVERAKAIILTPKTEWVAIDATPMTVRGIMTGWVVPLAAIGPIAGLIGGQLFGYGAFGIVYHPSLIGSLTTAILSFVMALVGTWVLSLIIDALAPSFGGTKNPVAAMKVAAFSATAGWLAGVFGILPALAFLSILGLYSLYLLYLGLPLLMKAPADKATGYVVVTIVAAAVVFIVIGAITGSIAARAMTPAAIVGSTGGTLTVPGLGSVDTAKIDAATKQMSAAVEQAQTQSANPKPPTPPATLQALLPAAIGRWTRTEIESASGGGGAIGGSTATGRYKMGDDSITLTVSDIGAMGAIAAMGAAFNVQSSKQTATGYEKAGTVDGRMTTDKWDGADYSGSYTVIVGNRFTVTAEGTARDAAPFKGAVDAIDLGKLEAMAKG